MHNWSGVYEGKYKRSKEDRRGCGRPFQPMLQVRYFGGLGKHQGAVVACCMVLGNDAGSLQH